MKIFSVLTVVLSALIYQITPVESFFFYIEPGQSKCFYHELNQGTFMVGKYRMEEFDSRTNSFSYSPSDNGLAITVEETFDNNHLVVNQRGSASGDFTFTALDSGEHRICFRSTSRGWFSSTRNKMSLDIKIGDRSEIDSKGEDKMDKLAIRVRTLNNKVLEIRREQDLMREREAQFRNQSESTNARVVKWSIFQLVVLGVAGVWQMNHLRGFFMKKKLV